MEFKGLIFGVGLILREQIDGWSKSASGTANVYPDHPPLDLSKSSYPRATVDQIGYDPILHDLDQEVFVGDALVQITVYGINSVDVIDLVDQVDTALKTYHRADADNGDPYLPDWEFKEEGDVSNIMERRASGQDSAKGFTRYQKSTDFVFQTVNAVQPE